MGHLFNVVNPGSGSPEMARFTIHIPERDNNGVPIPHLLEYTRQLLSRAGFHGRTVSRGHTGDWMGEGGSNYESEEMALISIDAPDDADTVHSLQAITKGVEHASGQVGGIYVSAQPITAII